MKSEENRTPTNEYDRNLQIMEVVEKELEKQKGEVTFCLTFFLCALSIWILLVSLWEMLGQPFKAQYLTFGVELIAIIMLVVVLKFTRIDIRKMGITKKNLGPSLVRAGIISAIAVAVMLVYKLITKPGEPIFNWSRFDFSYFITSPLQEFLARGFLLTTLINVNSTKNSKHIAVVCSSLMFASLHLFYGFPFMAGAGLLSIVLGYCYLKDGNIWGVSVIHFFIGIVGMMLDIV